MKSLIQSCSQYIQCIYLTVYYRRFYYQNLSRLKKRHGGTLTEFLELIVSIQQLAIYTKLLHKMQNICDALGNLVPFVQFKKCEKHPWRGFKYTPPWMFFTFLKLHKWYQIAQHITYFVLSSGLIPFSISKSSHFL